MRAVLSEKNLVIVLFIMVLVAFSFAHEDSKKMEQIFAGANQSLNSTHPLLTQNDPLIINDTKKPTSGFGLTQ